MTDRDFYSEAIDLATNEHSPYTLELGHLRALWDMETAMTLRMADVHERAQRAELAAEMLRMERDSLKVQLHTAQDTLRDLYRDIAALQVPAEPPARTVERGQPLPIELEDDDPCAMKEMDAMDVGKRYNREQDEAQERQKGEGE